ncbi:ubiquitin-conjugating enzyme E2 T-like [Nilaparvata lugens]|uniref:ubiquitin-conjugating enzyme E2 T-like n=1 Tax=Nilaparvata lugens TaxID=108931 RepID=UPI00193D29FB|nr:ubiquitin-conjugating enzyme E2 T-like [Nilaparvata lugens]
MSLRLKKEVQKLSTNPPPGISCCTKNDNLNNLEASIVGANGSPYEKGVFQLELIVTEKYPFEPPRIKFVTPIYHPNVDAAGRICLDVLKMPPNGGWKPTATIEGLLIAIQSLIETPNPDDPLMPDIAQEFKYDKTSFHSKAEEWTLKHAVQTLSVLTEKPDNEKKSAKRKSSELETRDENDAKKLKEN